MCAQPKQMWPHSWAIWDATLYEIWSLGEPPFNDLCLQEVGVYIFTQGHPATVGGVVQPMSVLC